jgi:cytidylate kinase
MADNNKKDKAEKYIKISITGELGSGKSTVSRILQEKYNLKLYSVGTIQRALAEQHGMDILDFNKYMETHPEIDNEIDDKLAEIGRRPENMILDSRMAWHFVPDSYKVFLTVDTRVAAQRIMDADRGAIECYDDIEDACQKITERKESENYRYKTIYDVDCADLCNYNLIVDTSDRTPEEVADIIIKNFEKSFF